MKLYHWNFEKNEKLIRERGVCFEEVVLVIEKEKVLDVVGHPNAGKYGGQKMYVVELNNYVYLVPFVEDKETVFLKTIIPSRKATKKYLRRAKDENA